MNAYRRRHPRSQRKQSPALTTTPDPHLLEPRTLEVTLILKLQSNLIASTHAFCRTDWHHCSIALFWRLMLPAAITGFDIECVTVALVTFYSRDKRSSLLLPAYHRPYHLPSQLPDPADISVAPELYRIQVPSRLSHLALEWADGLMQGRLCFWLPSLIPTSDH